MAKTMRAKYTGRCAGCGGDVAVGSKILWAGPGKTYHHACAPSGDKREDREYWQGRAEADQYMQNRRIYGDELAEQWELEKEAQQAYDY